MGTRERYSTRPPSRPADAPHPLPARRLQALRRSAGGARRCARAGFRQRLDRRRRELEARYGERVPVLRDAAMTRARLAVLRGRRAALLDARFLSPRLTVTATRRGLEQRRGVLEHRAAGFLRDVAFEAAADAC